MSKTHYLAPPQKNFYSALIAQWILQFIITTRKKWGSADCKTISVVDYTKSECILWRRISQSLFHSQGRNWRECLQSDEEGCEVVYLWILQKTKGQNDKCVEDFEGFLCILLTMYYNNTICHVALSSTGFEEALQSHYWRDVPLHVAPSENK